MLKRKCALGLLFALLVPSWCIGAPWVQHTDITSGPVDGGENNHGIYITIYGHNFGVSQNDSKVLINNIEVSAYKYWSNNRISVQPGPAVNSGPIRVQVKGEVSNTDIVFTARPGRIYFVSKNGSDIWGSAGNINKPYRNAQATFNSSSFRPGDFLVLRGGTWSDVGDYESRFMNIGKDGAEGKPLTIMAYPGEEVIIRPPKNVAAFRFYRHSGKLSHTVIAGFKIHVSGEAGCVHLGYGSSHLRVVGIDGQGMSGTSGGSGCITGSASHTRILGNTIHDNTGDKLYHAIYIDNDQNPGTVNDVEIAYNHIYNQRAPKGSEGSGRGIQIYWEGRYRIAFTDFRIHHNIIHDIDRDGITLGNQTGAGFEVYDNIIYRTGLYAGAGIRFGGRDLEAKIYNNTIFDVASTREIGAIWYQNAKQINFYNNIVQIVSPAYYLSRDNDVPSSAIKMSHNLWYGAGRPPSLDKYPVGGDALFRNPTAADFHLSANSPAIDTGTTEPGMVRQDFDGNRRPRGKAPDIGAYEF